MDIWHFCDTAHSLLKAKRFSLFMDCHCLFIILRHSVKTQNITKAVPKIAFLFYYFD